MYRRETEMDSRFVVQCGRGNYKKSRNRKKTFIITNKIADVEEEKSGKNRGEDHKHKEQCYIVCVCLPVRWLFTFSSTYTYL